MVHAEDGISSMHVEYILDKSDLDTFVDWDCREQFCDWNRDVKLISGNFRHRENQSQTEMNWRQSNEKNRIMTLKTKIETKPQFNFDVTHLAKSFISLPFWLEKESHIKW